MPKLPTYMMRRGKAFYFRMRNGNREKWVSLGTDYRKALEAYRELCFQYSGQRNHNWVQTQLKRFLGNTPDSKPLVDQVVERWLDEYVATRRNAKGRRLAKQRYDDYLKPVLGQIQVGEVTSSHLRHLRLTLEQSGLSVNSVRHILSDVRCLFLYAEKELRWIDRSPFPRRFLPEKPEETPRRLTDEVVNRLFSVASTDEALVLHVALETGLRWGELRSLRWRNLQSRSNGWHLVVEKTKSKKVRRVPVTKRTTQLLEARRSKTQDDPMLPFLPADSSTFSRRLMRKSGVRWYIHQLRHTFASRWLEAGGSKEVLREMLGHSTIRVTERYGKVSDDMAGKEFLRVAKRVAAKGAEPPLSEEVEAERLAYQRVLR